MSRRRRETVGVAHLPVTMDRAARRYGQIAALEREIAITEAKIKEATQHVTDARGVVKELREKQETLWVDLRAAVCDEGDLPLFEFLAEEEAGVLPIAPEADSGVLGG